jgi:predicted MFS family arabinose efflux permease
MTAQASETSRGRTRSVLRRRDYLLLLTSFATSRVGDFLYLVAMAAYVYERTGSAAWVSAAALARFIPYTALSAPAGVIADRYERRLVMATSDVAQLVAMVLLTLVGVLSGPVVLVVALSALSAAAATLYHASASAMVASTVPEDELAAANALLSTVDTVAFIAGPAAGGLLLLLGSPVAAFGINAATFAVSAVLLLSLRTRSRPASSGERAGAVHELREGVQAFLGNRVVAVLVGCLVAGTLVYGVELVVLVLVSSRLLGTGTEGLGWLLAASGAGGLVGAALSSRLESARRPRATIAVLVLLTGLPMASLALIRVPLVAYAVLLVEGTAIVALDVLVTTAMQRGVAADVLGRVSGLVLSLTAIGTAIGTLAAPALVAGLGLVTTLLVAGVVPVVLAAAGVLRLAGFDSDVERGRRELAPRVRLLEELRIFDGAERPALERIAAAVEERRVPAGTIVLRQGDAPDDLYVLVEGALAVDREDRGVVRHVNDMAAPDYLGEIGLVEQIPRTATVTAATEAVLWRVPGQVFLDAVTSAPELPALLAGGMRMRLARTPAARRAS